MTEQERDLPRGAGGRFSELPEPTPLEELVAVKPVGYAAVASAPLWVGLGDPNAGGGIADADGD